jgi:hypothetical protein
MKSTIALKLSASRRKPIMVFDLGTIPINPTGLPAMGRASPNRQAIDSDYQQGEA